MVGYDGETPSTKIIPRTDKEENACVINPSPKKRFQNVFIWFLRQGHLIPHGL